MNLIRIGQEGFANLYYAAAVKSMLMNFHNFFFVSFDPGGFISVDKPPLGFWLQVFSARVLGFRGWSILLPQAIAGIISVAIVYRLVGRYWGILAGVAAAFALAVTPIAVAANRNNTIDSLLTMTVLLAAWAMLKAIEKDKTQWLYGAMIIMGIAYNIKTLEAFLVLPALCLMYLVMARRSIKKRLLHLAGALGLMLIIALSWSVIVDMTPASERPYVGSSKTNSELELATGYNGLLHFFGKGVQVPGVDSKTSNHSNLNGSPDPRPQVASGANSPNSPGGPGTPGPMPGDGIAGMASFSFETGNPGILRLFQKQIGGQLSWLLPLALFGLFLAATRRIQDNDKLKRGRNASLLLWGGWLLPQMIFFSIAVDYHRYYLVMMAPAIAALVGIGLKELFDASCSGMYSRWLLPLILVTNLSVEAGIAWQFTEWRNWLLPLLGITGIIAIGCLMISLRRHQLQSRVLALIPLFIPQILWALTPILYGDSTVLPYAGPDLNPKMVQNAGRGMAMPRMGANEDATTQKLEEFLLANRRGEKFILAVGNANEAAQIILDTGQPVMAVGGFIGMETILSAADFEQLVNDGKVRYVLLSQSFEASQPALNTWILANGKAVPSELWGKSNVEAVTPEVQSPSFGPVRRQRLFECSPKNSMKTINTD